MSAGSCYELARLVARGRIRLDRPVVPWIARARAGGRPAARPTHRAATEAAALGAGCPSDPLDRMILATSRERGARLVTADARLRAAGPAATVW